MIEKAVTWWETLTKIEIKKFNKKHKVKTETVKSKVLVYFREEYFKK